MHLWSLVGNTFFPSAEREGLATPDNGACRKDTTSYLLMDVLVMATETTTLAYHNCGLNRKYIEQRCCI